MERDLILLQAADDPLQVERLLSGDRTFAASILEAIGDLQGIWLP